MESENESYDVVFYLNAPKSVTSMFTLSSKVQKFTSPVNANIIKCTNIKYTKYYGEYHAKHSNLYVNNNTQLRKVTFAQLHENSQFIYFYL